MDIPEPATPTPSHAEIAAKAYALWQQDGCLPGRDLDHWLRAETLLNRTNTPAPPGSLASDPQPAARALSHDKKPAARRRASNRRQAG